MAEKIESKEKNSKHQAIIEVEGVNKNFFVGEHKIPALKNINLKIYPTDFLVIYGPSGCGKSTLLNLILGLDKPTSGEIEIREKKINLLSDDDRAMFRAKKIGAVYQLPYWIKALNSLENVMLPLIIQGISEENAGISARKIMADLKITDLANQLPTQLSGGQQQKLNLARALVSNPWILVADEPTGNLDSISGSEIMEIFQELNQKYRRAIILVTHNEKYWNVGNRKVEMKDGAIIKESRGG